MPERLTPEERTEIKAFVRAVYERSEARTVADFARRAKVSEGSLREWLSGKEQTLPSAINMLRLLASVGVVRGDFSLPQPSEIPAPARWEQARAAAVRLADGAEELARLLAEEETGGRG